MRTIIFSALFLFAMAADAQQHNLFDADQYFKNKFSAPFTELYKQPGLLQTQSDTSVYSLMQGMPLTYTLTNGDKVEYGNGQMPVIIPNKLAMQENIPNPGMKAANNLLIRGQMPNAAPPQPPAQKPLIPRNR